MSEQLFKDFDLVVLIDDWKAASNDSTEELSYFVARTFPSADAATVELCDLLSGCGAAAWHASGDRGECRFLFDSPAFDTLLALLGTAKTLRFDMMTRIADLETEAIRTKWQRLLAENPELRKTWDVSSPYARALFRFADFLATSLSQQLSRGMRVRLVTDRVDWISNRRSDLEMTVDDLAMFGWGERGIRADHICLAEKSAPGAAPYLPLLGLVDSEAWAFGRLNSLRLSDGSRIWERYIRWQRGGAPQDGCVVSEAEFEQALAPHRDHHNLRAYWDALMSWDGRRSFTLRE